MRTLENILRQDARQQRAVMRKFRIDIMVQTTLYAVFILSLFSYCDTIFPFAAHYMFLALYHLISHAYHPESTPKRQEYDKWLKVHLIAFFPCVVFYPLLIVFMITSTLLGLYYFYITITEFYERIK